MIELFCIMNRIILNDVTIGGLVTILAYVIVSVANKIYSKKRA